MLQTCATHAPRNLCRSKRVRAKKCSEMLLIKLSDQPRCEILSVVIDRSNYPTKLRRLHDPEDNSYVDSLTAAERIEMVWQLTLTAWAFKGGPTDEPRLRRDVVRLERRPR